MAKCKDCGKSGLFLHVNRYGRCDSCEVIYQKKIEEERIRKERDLNNANIYFEKILELFKEISTPFSIHADPYEQLNDIPLFDEKIKQCNELIKLIDKYNSIPHLKQCLEKRYGVCKTSYIRISELDMTVFIHNSDILKEIFLSLKNKASKNMSEARVLKENAFRYAFFQNALDSLSSFDIHLSLDKIPKRCLSEISDTKFSSVTAKSNYDKLGNFVVIDLETTGLSNTKDEILEIAAISFEDWEPKNKFETFIMPSKRIPENITTLTGITNEMVINAPKINEVIPALSDFIGKQNLVGHNIYFDMKFLCASGFDFTRHKRKYFDTLELAKKVLKIPKKKWNNITESYEPDYYGSVYDVDDYKLVTLCQHYKIRNNEMAHRAASDCLATGILFQYLVQRRIGLSIEPEIYSERNLDSLQNHLNDANDPEKWIFTKWGKYLKPNPYVINFSRNYPS